ncbi:MAG: IS200/IS605 family transposase [Pyrinomonadaceae bacterium]|nr:IS200/IS605 family transposase [Pyrinomonadaceae bacterium]
MPRRVYSEINLHIIWHTKNNVPMIFEQIESELYSFLKTKIIETPEVFFHAIGGIKDHIHLAVSIPPTLKIDEWVGKLKGGSSFFINNKVANRKVLEWQNGYGIVSFGTKDLKWVVSYIENQKEHHKTRKVYQRLERIDIEDS